MRPTLPFLYDRFAYFNKLCFGNQLPQVPITLSRANRSLGQLRYKKTHPLLGRTRITNVSIGISIKFDLPEAEVEDTLIHEMIHLYILVNNLRDSSAHGPLFRKLMNDINQQHGRHISVTHHSTAEEAASRIEPRANYVCVCTLTDGRHGITVAAKTAIFALWRDIPRIPTVKHCDWYFSTEPFLSRYRRSRTAKIYAITDQHLQQLLATGIPLVNENGRIFAK